MLPRIGPSMPISRVVTQKNLICVMVGCLNRIEGPLRWWEPDGEYIGVEQPLPTPSGNRSILRASER